MEKYWKDICGDILENLQGDDTIKLIWMRERGGG